MAGKLYTIRDIVELFNRELAAHEASYRFTEQSVRSRMRYLRSKGVDDQTAPIITPKVFGYDKRTKYYTEEDVEILRRNLVGPMMPEFHDYEEDLPILEEVDQIEVRPASAKDVDTLISPISLLHDAAQQAVLHDNVSRMIKEPNSKTFIAVDENRTVLGWAQVRIAFAQSVAFGQQVGQICFWISPTEKLSEIALRSLYYRSERWLSLRDTRQTLIEIPASMSKFEGYLRNLHRQRATNIFISESTTS